MPGKLAVLDETHFSIDLEKARVVTAITTDILHPTTFWDNYDTYRSTERANREAWVSVTEEERREVTFLVKQAMGVMYDKVDDWLPAGFSLDEVGKTLNVSFTILSSEVVERIDMREKSTTSSLRDLADEALHLFDDDEDDQ